MSRVPASPRDLEHRRRLLAVAVSILGGQDEAAEVIGVTQSTISHWIAGKREVEWHVVLAAVARAVELEPTQEGRLIEALVRRTLGRHGTWVPDSGGTGDWATEGSEAVSELGDLHRAMRQGDPDEIESKARSAIRETHEAAVVALGVAAARRRGRVA